MSQSLFATSAPMPAKPRVKINLVGDELTLDWSRRQWGVAGFLCLWLTGWTAGCAMITYQLITKFEWQMALFATPFYTAWFVVAGLIVYMLLGRQRLVLSRDEMSITWKAGVNYYRRVVPLDEVARATPDVTYTHQKNGPPKPLGVLSIETLGKPAHFASGIDDDEAKWLAETINVCLDGLAPHRTAVASSQLLAKAERRVEHDSVHSEDDEEGDDDENMDVVVYQPTGERQLRPSDSTWQLEHQGRSLEFSNRGRWSLGSIGGSLFINLFWNGIVSLFVVELFKNFEWFLALFLVPFVVIGLCIFAAFLAAITAPGWGVRYIIQSGQIEHRWWCPVYGLTKVFPFEQLDRIEISDSGFSEPPKNQITTKHLSQGDYQIALVDTNNAEVATIESLTEGEALWMADTIMFEHPELFDRDR